jgi:hypothetical protein
VNKKINCEFGQCTWESGVEIYPANSRHAFIAVNLCEKHYDQMIDIMPPRQDLYKFAARFVTTSLV